MKTARILLALIAVAFFFKSATADTLHVPGQYASIQAAINAASDSDIVLVQRGTYSENIDFLTKNILVASNYINDGLEATIESTVIDGGGVGRVVKMQSVNGTNVGIVGFTIRNGYADDGAGIYCKLSSARISHNLVTGDTANCYGGGICVVDCSPTIDSNRVIGNEAYNGGGIKFSESASGEVFGNLIRGNHAQNGGGIQIYGGSSPEIHHNTIDSNTARYYGGGIECAGGSTPLIRDNEIVEDSASSGGGGIRSASSSPTIQRNRIENNATGGCGAGILVMSSHASIDTNLILSNRSYAYGGGVEFYGDSSRFENNTVYANSATEYNAGGGVHCAYYSAPTIRNNIITGSTDGCGISCSATSDPDISYNDVWDHPDGNFCGCDTLLGRKDTVNFNSDSCDVFFNISFDPLFDPDSTNYALLCSSKAIDAGDTTFCALDLRGAKVDQGAWEYPYILGDANGNGIINVGDIVFLNAHLYQGGPCPCPSRAGDATCDGVVNVGDVVYLVAYLYRGGPPPHCCDCCTTAAKDEQDGLHAFVKKATSSRVGFASATLLPDGSVGLAISGEFSNKIAAVDLEIGYDPEKIEVLSADVADITEHLQVYYGHKDELLKIGIMDIYGGNSIQPGEGTLMTLRLKGTDLSSLEISNVILVDEHGNMFEANVTEKLEMSPSSRPAEFSLAQNYPNPFNPETQISYALLERCQVKLSIYNVRGQRVRILVNEFQAAGHNSVVWDGKNEDGHEVASGIYFYRLDAGDFTDTKSMVLLK